MRTEVEIRRDGYQAIFEKLDIVEAERFVSLAGQITQPRRPSCRTSGRDRLRPLTLRRE